MGELTEIDWASAAGQWSISQTDVNWHGVGAAALVATLRGWEARYAELDSFHHTERLCYVDSVPEGFYTLMADIVSNESRRAWHVSLSFQLSGVPLDQAPYQRLAEAVAPGVSTYFRPRGSDSVTRLGLGMKSPPLETVATVTEREEDGAGGFEEWVVGVVAKNPLVGRSELMGEHAEMLRDLRLESTELLICDLGSWHPSDEPRDYKLIGLEWAYSSDVAVLRARADWLNPPKLGEEVRPR
jgi:hypothetical protein